MASACGEVHGTNQAWHSVHHCGLKEAMPDMGDDNKHQKVPRGRLGRLARLARAGARTGVAMLRPEHDATKSAQATAKALGQLRGLATKVGQMASYVDGVIPPEHRQAYEDNMARLQNATPRSAPEEIKALIEQELGKPLDELFADWEEEPLASASIGQVHRATLHDGRRVAVKVQHPGIIEAIEADLKNTTMMDVAARMAGMGKFEPGRLFEEAKARFREELDYTHEAAGQRLFATLHADDPQIVIPKIIDSHSSKRVLTSDLLTGVSFEEAQQAPEALRSVWAGVLWRFVYRSMLWGGVFNADPHPGNYLFYDDGRVGFLDFGCLQHIPEYRRQAAVRMHQASQDDDQTSFEAGARTMLHLQGGLYEEMALDYARQCFRPLEESPFRITRQYAGSLVERMKEMTVELRRNKDAQYVAMPDGFLFINRLQFGFYSVLARLDAPVDYATIEAGILPEAGKGRAQCNPVK